MNGRRVGVSLGSAVLAGLLLSSTAPAWAQANNGDVTTQIQRLQRDVRDLQAEYFREHPAAPGQVQVVPPAVPPEDSALRQRVDDIENGLQRLTGELEELGHKVDVLSQQSERLQKQLDFMANQQAQAATQAEAANAQSPTVPDTAVASAAQGRATAPPPALAPAEGVLGTLPKGTPMPQPQAAPADPAAEFDAAMGLLTRAQYDRASDAFRAFADAHPDTELGAQALYWTGDIAYSTKKDYATAARDFAELLKKYPKAPRAPEGMLKLGLSLIALGQTKEGCVALAALPKSYPNAAPAIATKAKTEAKNAACG